MAPRKKTVETAPNNASSSVASGSVSNDASVGVGGGATHVEGAMHALQIAPAESGQNDLSEMDVDIDMDASDAEEEDVEPAPVTVEAAREHVNSLGVMFRVKTAAKMAVRSRMLAAGDKATDRDEQRCHLLDAEIDRLRDATVEWSSMLDDMERADRAAKRTVPIVVAHHGDLGTVISRGKATGEIKLTPEYPKFHRKVEAHLMPVLDRKTQGQLISNVREFLYEIKRVGRLKRPDDFEDVCYVIVSLANLDKKVADAFSAAHEKDPKGDWGWDRCEQVFVDSALTVNEKSEEVELFAKAGRDKGESYREFEYRLRRLVEVYRVKELPKHADVASSIQMSIPSLALTVMQMGQVMKMMLQHINMPMPEVNTLDFLVDSISNVHGPDDCDEWKKVIDENKRRKAAKETEENRIAQQVKDRHLNHNKKTTAMAAAATVASVHVGGGGGGSQNTIPVSTNNHHGNRGSNGFFRGGRGGRGGRGNFVSNGAQRGDGAHRGRGGYGQGGHTGDRFHPFHGEKGNGKPHYAVEKEVMVAEEKNEECVININSVVIHSEQVETSKDELKQDLPSEKIQSASSTKDRVTNKALRVGVEHNAEECVNKSVDSVVKKKARRCDAFGLGMSVHVGPLPRGSPDGGDSSCSAEVAGTHAKVRYGAASVVEGESDFDTQREYRIEDVEHDDYTRAFEKFSLTDNPVADMCDGYPLLSFGEGDFALVQKHYGASKRKGQPDNRLFVPVYIRKERHLALIDTGASHSFISAAVVQQYSISVQPRQGYIVLADSSTIERVGETENVEIICGQNLLCAPYEVIEQKHAITIGMDLFHRYGFNIIGLPDPEESSDRMPVPVEDEKPVLIPLTVPDIEKTTEFVQEKKQFMQSITELLKANARIPKTSHCTVPEMKVYLPVPDNVALYRRPKVFAASQIPVIDEAVKAWLDDDVITVAPAGNPHNNTLTLAAKKDADGNKTLYRVCLDPRPLNAYLPDDNFPVPLISDIMKFAGGNAVFSTVDLKQAYHRLPIHEEDQPLTAFMHNGIQYMFKKAPFGLKPLSSLFQRGTSRILGDLKFVRNFIDDILIASRSRVEHAIHVRMVIKRLTEAKLIINREKCSFFSTQVALLGFIVDVNGKRIDPNKLANIEEWLPPTTGKGVMSYMGTFNFFRDNVPLIATIGAPLDALRNVQGPFVLNKEQLRSFEALKNLLILAPIMYFADFSLPFYVATDASNVGIGAVLYQLPDGESNPKNIRYISFVARSLQPSERRYSATQRELLAIVFALKKLHYYLWGKHFTLFTDHRALTFMHSQKEMNSMLTAWQETILDYTFKVVYRPGVLNVLPDALSRQFPPELWTSKAGQMPTLYAYGYTHLIQGPDTPRETVSVSHRKELLIDTHALGHIGANAMVKHIHSLNKTWAFLAKDCLEYVQRCRECQRVNIARKGYHPMSAIHAQLPGEHMAMDLTGPFPVESDGNRFLLILVDVCTRFVFLVPIPNKGSITIARELYRIFTTIGFPRVLQSDNGTEFVNEIVTVMTKTMGVQHRLVTPYHPRGNGVAENHVKTACNMIRKEVHDHKETWARHVPMVQLAMNTRVVALHNSSPFSLFFARRFNGISNFSDTTGEPCSQEELLKRLSYMTETVFPAIETKARATQRLMIERFNRTVLHNEFPDGSKVMTLDPIKGDKLSPRYEGPYTVVRRTTGGAYELKDATGELLGRNFAPSQLKLVLDDFETTDTYVVDKILNHREVPGGGMEYRVSWKGYKERTWEPQDNFIERKCITDYWKTSGQPSAQSLPQPHQTTATHASRTRRQKVTSLQRKDTSKVSKNISTNDAPTRVLRKRARLSDTTDKSVDRRKSKRRCGA